MKNFLIISILLLSSLTSAFAQEKISFHQSYELADSTETISIQINNEYEHEFWAGNTILIQTEIELYNASMAVLNYFKEQGRYTIDSYEYGKETKLISQDSIQEPIQTKRGECYEIITTKILLPDTFSQTSDHTYSKAAANREDD